jgi:hypothetical protein
MEKKPERVRMGSAADRSKDSPFSLAEMLQQLSTMVPLTESGRARLEQAEREEAEAKLKKSTKAEKKPRR